LSNRRARDGALIVGVLLVVTQSSVPVETQPARVALRSYLSRAVTLSDAELSAIDRGRPVGKVVPSRNGAEIYVLGVIHIRASAQAYITRAMDPTALRTLPGYRGTGLITDATTESGLGGFSLEPDDVEDLKHCRPADCGLQVPASMIPAVREAARATPPARATALLDRQFRLMAIDLVRGYRLRGMAALPTFNDESRPAAVAEQFRSLMHRFGEVGLAPPEVASLMLDYPATPSVPDDLQSIFYWEKVVFGLKPTLRVTHAVAFDPGGGSPLGCVVAIKQLYASHYLRAAFDFASCLDAPDAAGRPGFYLVAFKGSRQEGVTGFTGSLIRRIVVGRVRTALDGSLLRIKAAMEGTPLKVEE
jgi:hypothetical protein